MSFFLSKYTNTDVGWGFAPDPTWGAYTAPQTQGFKEAASRQEGNGGEWKEA